MSEYDQRFYPYQQRMRGIGLPELFIETFAGYYQQLLSGETGLIPEAQIEPVESIVRMQDLPERLRAVGQESLQRTALIKLNGGLGTSMGLQQAKSLLVVRDGYTFLDIIAEQAVRAHVPLVFMNSFSTEADTREALSRHEQLQSDIPQTFVQHMEPKVRQDNFAPADWPADPDLTWCPPGHGDIYLALVTQGILEKLLQAGYQYAFISNADNLGATLDLSLLGYFAEKKLQFMMEVAERNENDRKGGHLAVRRQSGRLLLRELAQCPPQEFETFQDIELYTYFNTNNLWLNLHALDATLKKLDYKLGLPMIRNSKTVDPRDRSSTPVYQLETAMGSAIEVFAEAEAVVVPRSRFAPVKKTSDLLIVRSDVFDLTDEFTVEMRSERDGKPPLVTLDPHYYQFINDFDCRFASGVPSMIACRSLNVQGDVHFGGGVEILGDVEIENEASAPKTIPDGAVLQGE